MDFKKACDEAGIEMNAILITTKADNTAREPGSLRVRLGTGMITSSEQVELNMRLRVPHSLINLHEFKIGTVFRKGKREFRKWVCVLSCGGKVWDVKYSTGTGIVAPTREDVIASLFSDSGCAEESFSDFCSSMGYETDSRSALKTWKACRRNARKLKAFIPEKSYGILADFANEY
jgi:hypothetical protein